MKEFCKGCKHFGNDCYGMTENSTLDECGNYEQEKQEKKNMYSSEQEKLAMEFIGAIKTIAGKEENLNNFESYLIYHFPEWMGKFANTPEGLTEELKQFAEMEF